MIPIAIGLLFIDLTRCWSIVEDQQQCVVGSEVNVIKALVKWGEFHFKATANNFLSGLTIKHLSILVSTRLRTLEYT